MAADNLIQAALAQGRKTLTEAESKKLLSHYGVPVVSESICHSEADVVLQAERIRFPVVLKGLGASITHKTERGLVKVGLHSLEELRTAFRAIHDAAGADLEGCLIQPMVRGNREIVAGLFRDSQFGPIVMLGLGGIFAEVFKDVAFSITPFDATDATFMVDALASRKMLSDFRGESAVNQKQLVQILMGLARLAEAHPEIAEVDINPIIAGPDGRLTAVDALVALKQLPTGTSTDTALGDTDNSNRSHAINAALQSMTHPKSVAVVGAKRSVGERFKGIFHYIVEFGFSGNLYPINPNVGDVEILGHKAYPNLCSLPEPVDLVIISVPAKFVPDALRDCAASGNKHVHIFSSGFKETGEAEGMALQKEIETIAKEGDLHVIGPNCMGLYVPSASIVTWPWATKKSGPMAFVSQSGGYAQDFTRLASRFYNLHCSKVISYGNALTLDSTDFLEFLSQDDATRVIGMYLEGVKEGRRLLNVVKAVNRKKPVIIIKAGLTESGAKAVVSHTGSLAGSEKIWDAFFRQSGAVSVDNVDEVAEMAMAFLHLPPCHGRRAAVLATGGGIGVTVADECAKAGLELPTIPPSLMAKLREYIPAAGNMVGNPMDAHLLFFSEDLFSKTLDLLSAEDFVDMFIISLHMDWFYSDSHENDAFIRKVATYLATEARKHTAGKPLIAVWRQYENNTAIFDCLETARKILIDAGIPFYHDLPKGTRVLSKFAQYHALQKHFKDS